MATLRDKKTLPLDAISTWRETTPSELSSKFTNMKRDFSMQRDFVPAKVAQASDGPTRKTNHNGRPTR